ncbi:MAG: SPOR domain-containing protein [Spirochaetes bacterium]|nr:SPOR domain-containing protein [Spirochaetota bacterium]
MKKKILLITFLFSFMFLFSQTKELDIYKKALSFDQIKNYKSAVKYYKEYLNISKDNAQKEKIQLRIARITSDFDASVVEYNTFLSEYPKSRFRFLARYELASLYKFKGKFKEALAEFYEISQRSKGTPYWQKALLVASEIEYELLNFKDAIKNLYEVLEEIEDYEDLARAYFLLGAVMLKQGLTDDAEQFYLITAGTFPLSCKAPAALLELLKIYLAQNKPDYSKKIQTMIGELYPDSPQNHEAQKYSRELKDVKELDEFIELNLINLEENNDYKKKSLARLRADIKLSNEEFIEKKEETAGDKKELKSGYYLQIGYFSSEENSKTYVDNFNKKWGEKAFYSETVSSKTGLTNFRILIGPFDDKTKANDKLIELKDKNVEAITLELGGSYD